MNRGHGFSGYFAVWVEYALDRARTIGWQPNAATGAVGRGISRAIRGGRR